MDSFSSFPSPAKVLNGFPPLTKWGKSTLRCLKSFTETIKKSNPFRFQLILTIASRKYVRSWQSNLRGRLFRGGSSFVRSAHIKSSTACFKNLRAFISPRWTTTTFILITGKGTWNTWAKIKILPKPCLTTLSQSSRAKRKLLLKEPERTNLSISSALCTQESGWLKILLSSSLWNATLASHNSSSMSWWKNSIKTSILLSNNFCKN